MFVLLLLTSWSLALVQRSPIGATVQTSSGAIVGHAARNRTRVSEYLGIPYAKPPLGDLRFAAPQDYAASQSSGAPQSYSFTPEFIASTYVSTLH